MIDQMTWAPIETAPKDGRFVLAYGHGLFHVARWLEFTDSNGEKMGYWDDWDMIVKATHWMPLVEPRESGETACLCVALREAEAKSAAWRRAFESMTQANKELGASGEFLIAK